MVSKYIVVLRAQAVFLPGFISALAALLGESDLQEAVSSAIHSLLVEACDTDQDTQFIWISSYVIHKHYEHVYNLAKSACLLQDPPTRLVLTRAIEPQSSSQQPEMT